MNEFPQDVPVLVDSFVVKFTYDIVLRGTRPNVRIQIPKKPDLAALFILLEEPTDPFESLTVSGCVLRVEDWQVHRPYQIAVFDPPFSRSELYPTGVFDIRWDLSNVWHDGLAYPEPSATYPVFAR